MTALLPPGAIVRVRDDWPEARGPVHVRTPHYLRGRTGTIVLHLGRFPDPGDLAFARQAPLLDLYHVAFDLALLWPERRAGEVLVELYAPWLEHAR